MRRHSFTTTHSRIQELMVLFPNLNEAKISDLNNELEEAGINQKYIFHFLSPRSYSEFFEYLRDGRLLEGKFKSELEDKLSIA